MSTLCSQNDNGYLHCIIYHYVFIQTVWTTKYISIRGNQYKIVITTFGINSWEGNSWRYNYNSNQTSNVHSIYRQAFCMKTKVLKQTKYNNHTQTTDKYYWCVLQYVLVQ